MATEEILQEFTSHVDEYEKHRAYISKAREQAHKFSSDVVEKVILDHEIKASGIADEILPLVPQLEEAQQGYESERDEVRSSKEDSDRKMEELELRRAIEELSEEDFESASAELREDLERAEQKIGELEGEIETLVGALDRWSELAEAAGQETGRAGAEEPEPEPEPESEEEPVEADDSAEEIMVEDSDGSHVSHGRMVEDVSAVFAEDDEESGESDFEADLEADDLAIEADEGDMADAAELEVESSEVELNLEPESEESEQLGSEIDISPVEDAEPGDVVDSRRALLLYQEGTAEEQIYPFTGDILTIGRGRDNDIQIKNDSKVSRYHCKVFRRGNNFYIEDNKSSNGTLVNGELITERRLFGGEEVIIGETFFRFRVME